MRARARPRCDEVVLAQPPECLADGVAADVESLAQLVFGRQLRAHRIDSVDDLFTQRARDLQIAMITRDGLGHQLMSCVRRNARMLPSPSAEM